MEKQYYQEMKENFKKLKQSGVFQYKKVYLFGHCNATEELAKLLAENGYPAVGILDNNGSKQGRFYQSIPIVSPDTILLESAVSSTFASS